MDTIFKWSRNADTFSRPPGTPKEMTPQVPFGMYFSANAWYLSPSRPGKLTQLTRGSALSHCATLSAFAQWRSMRTPRDSKCMPMIHELIGAGVEPKSRISCAVALVM